MLLFIKSIFNDSMYVAPPKLIKNISKSRKFISPIFFIKKIFTFP